MLSSFRYTFTKSFRQVVGVDDRVERDAKVVEDYHSQEKTEDSSKVLPAAVLSAAKVLAVAVADAVEGEITSTLTASILAKSAIEITQALKDKYVKPEPSRLNRTEIDPPKDESAKLETTKVEPQNSKSAEEEPAKTELSKIEQAKLEAGEVKPAKTERPKPELATSRSTLMETLIAELPKLEIADDVSEAKPAQIEPPEIERPKITVTRSSSVIRNDPSEEKVPIDNTSSISRKTNEDDEGSEESLPSQTRVFTYLKGLNEEKDDVRESYFGLYGLYDDDHNEDDLGNSASDSSNSGSSVCLHDLCELDHSLIEDNVSLASEPFSESEEVSSSVNINSSDVEVGEPQDCVACGDGVPEGSHVQAPCGHRHCPTCVIKLFELASRDEALFPPNCCKNPISLECGASYLREEVLASFNEFSVEYSTVNRTYCSAPSCSKFIPPSAIEGEKALCIVCKTKTCVVCKKKVHVAADCPKDPPYDSALKVFEANGYQQCPQCKSIVELSQGCHHIT